MIVSPGPCDRFDWKTAPAFRSWSRQGHSSRIFPFARQNVGPSVACTLHHPHIRGGRRSTLIRTRLNACLILVSCPRNNISFAEGNLSRGREARRRCGGIVDNARCCGIVDDERQRDRPNSPPPSGLRAQRPCFFVAPPRRWFYIDLSSRLESEPFRPQQMACYSWDRTLAGFYAN